MTAPGSTAVSASPVHALVVEGLSKRFGATLALDDVALHVRPGTVHALLGGNGSGKSTLVKVLAGVHPADTGRAEVHGVAHELDSWGANQAWDAGIRFVHQDLGLFEGLSVAENFALGAGYPTRPGGRVGWAALYSRVRELLSDYELDLDPRTPINVLRPADRTMVAIARAVQDQVAGQGVLVLDEPTASLGQHESTLLMSRIARRAELGQTIVMVSHRMSEVLAVAHDFTVFRDGRSVGTLVGESPTEDELVALMAGRAVEALRPVATSHPVGGIRLRVRGLVAGPLHGIDLDAAEGEVVGVAGLLGSGRSTLLRVLFGDQQPDSGALELDSAAYSPSSVRAAMARSVALVPEDRGRQAAFPDLPIGDNLSVTTLGRYWRARGMDRRAEMARADTLIRDFGVKTAGAKALFSSMSGGNQQKVVIARWLQSDPRLLLLDEPTQGVDVMSRVDIYRIVRTAAAGGTTVLVASSDPSELLALCDRIVVLRDGRVDQDLTVDGLEPEVLTAHLLRSAHPTAMPLEAR